MRIFGNGILRFFECKLLIIPDLHRRVVAAVIYLAGPAVRYQCTFQHLHFQGDFTESSGSNRFDCPCDNFFAFFISGAFIGYCTACFFRICACLSKLDMPVQCILDSNICRFCLIIPVADLIGDNIANLHTAQCAVPLVRHRLFLMRFFRHRVLNRIQRILAVASNLYRRLVAIVNYIAGTAVGYKSPFQHLHLQNHFAGGSGCHFLHLPGYDCLTVFVSRISMRYLAACILRFRISGNELHVLVQRVFDDDISCLNLIVPVTDFIGNHITNLHRAQDAVALVRSSLLLLRLFRLTVFIGVINLTAGGILIRQLECISGSAHCIGFRDAFFGCYSIGAACQAVMIRFDNRLHHCIYSIRYNKLCIFSIVCILQRRGILRSAQCERRLIQQLIQQSITLVVNHLDGNLPGRCRSIHAADRLGDHQLSMTVIVFDCYIGRLTFLHLSNRGRRSRVIHFVCRGNHIPGLCDFTFGYCIITHRQADNVQGFTGLNCILWICIAQSVESILRLRCCIVFPHCNILAAVLNGNRIGFI